MAKFNSRRGVPKYQTPERKASVVRSKVAAGRTGQGGAGYQRHLKGELFLLATSNFGQEKSFYTNSDFVRLIRQAAVAHPNWTARFLSWLRTGANMRTGAVMGAAHYVDARLKAQEFGGNRPVVASVLQRLDQVGELFAYWDEAIGTPYPMALKRGAGDALINLVNQYSYLKYDPATAKYRVRDLINLTHPGDWRRSKQYFRDQAQADLFEYILKSSYDNDFELPLSASMLYARRQLMAVPVAKRRKHLKTDELAAAGMTWEALAGWLQGPMDKQAWEAIIPTMNYMALLRNLRNFDEAGVSDEVATQVILKLTNPDEVARSKQFPMRFLAAYREAPSLRWSYPLEQALMLSLSNLPTLTGRTLVMIDASDSMRDTLSADSTMNREDSAVLFGLAIAGSCQHVDVVAFSADMVHAGVHYPLSKEFPYVPGESLLKSVARWNEGGYFISAGTQTAEAIRKHYRNHDRVIILTDEQFQGSDPARAYPATIPGYTWNLAGYRVGSVSGTQYRHTMGGLTDAALLQISALEAGYSDSWPF